MLITFLAIYGFRLLFDWLYVGIPGVEDALIFFMMVCAVPVTASMFAAPTDQDDILFAKWLMSFAILILVLADAAQRLGYSYNPWIQYRTELTRLGFEALNPISLGHVAGLSTICGVYLFVNRRPGMASMAAAGFAVFLGALMLVLANSRGPIIAAGFAISWFFLSRLRRAFYIAPLLLGVAYFLSSDNILITNVMDRFGGDLQSNASNAGRLLSQSLAIEAFFRSPLIGEFYRDPSLDEGSYPHNLIIETAMSLGLFGLTLLTVMFLRVWKNIISFYNAEHPLLVMLMLQSFVATSLSGAIWGADGFFLLLSLCLTARPRYWPPGFAIGRPRPRATLAGKIRTSN